MYRRMLRGVLAGFMIALFAFVAWAATESNADIDIGPTSGTEDLAVVFVHGVLGNARSTFKSDASSRSWPELLAGDPKGGTRMRVLSLAYESAPLQRASNIHEIATRLAARLGDKDVFKRASKVIFVTHSMGGLVARRMLLQISRDRPDDYSKVAGIFFLATPSGGSDAADLGSWMSRNPQFKDMKPIEFNTFLQAEEDDWAALLRKRTTDSPYPRTYCAYEKLAVAGLLVVPRNRAQVGCDERPIAFDRNHVNLVKPANMSDEVYGYVAARIRRLANDEEVPLKVDIRLVDATGARLPPNVALRSGDQYAVLITVTRPAWFYVFSEDSRAKVERFYPSRSGGRQAQPAKTLRIPADPTQMLMLDRNAGTERLTIVASVAGRTDLEGRGDEVGLEGKPAAQANRKPAGTTAQASLQEFMNKRGSVIAQKNGTVSAQVPQHLQVQLRPEDAVAWLTFAHMP